MNTHNKNSARSANVDRLLAIWEHKEGGCTGKKRFQYYDIPFMICKEYNERVALQFGDFAPYWCSHHDAWHVGHKGRKKAVLKALEKPMPVDSCDRSGD